MKKIFLVLAVFAFLMIPKPESRAQAGAPLLPTGSIVRAQGDDKLYYIDDGRRRYIDSPETFRVQGFQGPIRDIPLVDLGLYQLGDPITQDTSVVFPGEADIVPDITPFAAKDIKLVNRGGRLLLLFTTEFWNRGKGPLELDATTGKPTGDNVYETAQRIVSTSGSVRNKIVGNLFWHEIHKHFHYDDFASYVLEKVPEPAQAQASGVQASLTIAPDGLTPMGQVLGQTSFAPEVVNKSTFCIFESEHINLETQGVNKSKKSYTTCGKYRQGISVGWADKYDYTLPDQNFDVTDLPAGIYRLGFVLDPHQHFVEGSRDNNSSVTFVNLDPKAGTMQVLAAGSPFTTGENYFPNGMLVRSDASSDVYLIQNNKKQLMKNPPAGQVFVVPQGVLDAIPAVSLIKVTGSPTIYVLNDAGFRRGITSLDVFNSYGLKFQDVTEISPADLIKYPETDLIKVGGNPTVYSISTRKPFTSLGSLSALGANPASIHIINQTDFEAYMVTVAASGLFVPWDVAFLPGGDMLVPERSGNLRRIGSNPAVISVPSVMTTGEGGLMGLALDPKFADNSLIYLYYTTAENGQKNRVVRFRLDGNQLADQKILIDNIPSAIYHDGGRIAFGPDGMLYITTGNANSDKTSQDLNSLAGKTLRITSDGQVPSDNPFGTLVWSYGHRNSEGIAWDNLGRMWETEHGPTPGAPGETGCCSDEINLIQKGQNYGWPVIRGDQTSSGMVAAMLNSGPKVTWAPAGIAFSNGSLYFGGLKGETLYQIRFNGDGSFRDLQSHFAGQFGRIRAVVTGPDGSLYISTSNRDGRGTPRSGDDKIIRIYPGFLQN